MGKHGEYKMDETARAGGGTSAYQAMLERKRAALRRALKAEYIKKMYNPKSYTKEGYIDLHDANMMRFHATKISPRLLASKLEKLWVFLLFIYCSRVDTSLLSL